MTDRVAGLLLAAGEGSRLGRPKALVEFRGGTLAARGVATLRQAGADPVLVVTGAAPLHLDGTHTVHNPLWATGMGSSLKAGLAALSAQSNATAVVITLADQPLVTAATIQRLIDAHEQGAAVAVAAYHGKPRNPVLLAREHWAEVAALADGDTGARPFLRANPGLVTLVECADTGRPDDIDTQADLDRLLREDAPGVRDLGPRVED